MYKNKVHSNLNTSIFLGLVRVLVAETRQLRSYLVFFRKIKNQTVPNMLYFMKYFYVCKGNIDINFLYRNLKKKFSPNYKVVWFLHRALQLNLLFNTNELFTRNSLVFQHICKY